MKTLREQLTFNQANIQVLEESDMGGGKNLYLKGICIEGNKRNANDRVYPLHEISKAVNTINQQIKEGNSVLGEVDHPDDLKINLDRVCHSVDGGAVPAARRPGTATRGGPAGAGRVARHRSNGHAGPGQCLESLAGALTAAASAQSSSGVCTVTITVCKPPLRSRWRSHQSAPFFMGQSSSLSCSSRAITLPSVGW